MRYRVLRRLGAGGMAEVFLAEDTEFQREVALKYIQSHTIKPVELQRFFREAQAQARVRHPNVVEIFASHLDRERPWSWSTSRERTSTSAY